MNENSRRVLEMLAEGRITVDEAERLLSLVDGEPEATALDPSAGAPGPRSGQVPESHDRLGGRESTSTSACRWP